MFHCFLQYNMHVRLFHTLSKLKLAHARRSLKTTWKMSLGRTQKKREIYENLSKVGTEMKIIQKTCSEVDFYQIWLDFGVSRRAQKHQKLIKKQAEKTAKKKNLYVFPVSSIAVTYSYTLYTLQSQAKECRQLGNSDLRHGLTSGFNTFASHHQLKVHRNYT